MKRGIVLVLEILNVTLVVIGAGSGAVLVLMRLSYDK